MFLSFYSLHLICLVKSLDVLILACSTSITCDDNEEERTYYKICLRIFIPLFIYDEVLQILEFFRLVNVDIALQGYCRKGLSSSLVGTVTAK